MGMCGTQALQKLVETCSFTGGWVFVMPGKDTGCHGMESTGTGAVTGMNSAERFTLLVTAPEPPSSSGNYM